MTTSHVDRQPRSSEKELERLSGIGELITPFQLSSPATLAAGIESWLVRTSLTRGREGVLVSWAASWPGDWSLSPVYVATLEIGTKSSTTGENAGAIGTKRLGPFKAAIGSLASPLDIPHGLFFKEGLDVGLVLKNGEAAPNTGVGFISGFTWNERHARKVREVLMGQGFLVPPWPKNGSPFGGP